jgi:hypothetical protein
MEFQAQRPQTARSASTRPSTVSGVPDRLHTANSSSPYFDAPKVTRPSPFAPPTVEAGSLSAPYQRSPERPANNQSQPQEQAAAPFITRDEATAPRLVAPARPTTSQLYRSTTTPALSQNELNDTIYPPQAPAAERRSSTSNIAFAEAIRNLAEQEITPPNTSLPQSTAQPAQTDYWSSGATEPPNPGNLSSDPPEGRPHTARPSTGATTAPPDSQEFAIPPKRELPFKRPESKRGGGGLGANPPSSALTMPPLPKPRLAREGSGSPVRPDVASPAKQPLPRTATASPLKRSFNAYEENLERPQKALAAATKAPAMLPPPTVLGRTPSLTKPLPWEQTVNATTALDELLSSRMPVIERSTNTNVPRVSSLEDAPHEVDDGPPTQTFQFARPSRNTVPQASLAVQPPAENAGAMPLEEYATQSYQDRQAALEDFFMSSLENPAFAKLCEDVENSWKRIALGL